MSGWAIILVAVAGCGRIGFGEDVGDSRLPDGRPDDAPVGPLLVSGQAADLVLGQPDFVTVTNAVVHASSLDRPEGVTTDGTRLWVHDNGNARILGWTSLPTTNGEAADLVLGQPDMSSEVEGLSQTSFDRNDNLWEFDGSFTDGQRLYVAHHDGGRTMIWDPIPTTSNTPMQLVLGTTSFTSCCSGDPAASFGDPTGIWTDGNQLIIADIHRHRVMIWPTIPTANGKPATIVVGRADFTAMTSPVQPPSASTMYEPHGVHVAGGRMFLADTANHRILVWNQIPTVSNTPADFVIGQPDFVTSDPNAGGADPTAATLHTPVTILTVGDHLIVSDAGNNRVLVYTPIPTATGASASIVLGQSGFDAADLTPAPAADRFRKPIGLSATPTALFVSDIENHRVLRFTFGP